MAFSFWPAAFNYDHPPGEEHTTVRDLRQYVRHMDDSGFRIVYPVSVADEVLVRAAQ